MPPRLRRANLPAPATASSFWSCPSVRPQCIASRDFSHTSCQQDTLRRRKFYEWLNGPGSGLKDPVPGSTNYLGAYDKYGNVVRAPPDWKRPIKDDPEDRPWKASFMKAAEGTKSPKDEAAKAPEGQEDLDTLEAAIQEGKAGDEEKKASVKEDATENNKLPPETAEDLRPFPLNPFFRSQPVLSEELREAIYQRVKKDGATVSLASVEFGVSNERVGAVVRLKQMEKEWIAQGKHLAMPYSKAVLAMLPTTPFIDTSIPANRNKRPIPHEPINDLPVHPATRQQLFVPVSESRRFTRVDAGKAFDNHLLPADERIPHPELVQAEREIAQGLSFEERKRLAEERLAAETAEKQKLEAQKQAELQALKVVPKRRWDFVFQDISVDSVGRDGRKHTGVGWRYGVPHQDRKKGQVKIPTKVEA
ncbi:hypothetical protein ACEQ8H_003377 [Pleosporales sp. CAS-2024a]